MMPARGSSLYVLEDSDEDFDTLEIALRKAGLSLEVHRAVTGEGFLDLVRGRVEGGRLDPLVALIDLNTPGLDGRDVLRDLKSDARLRSVPVVVLTTSASPRDVEACYAAGANAFHVKPFDHGTHQTVLQKILGYWMTTTVLPDVPRPVS